MKTQTLITKISTLDTKIIVGIYLLALFMFSLSFLVTTPKAVGLLESTLFVSPPKDSVKLPVVIPEVAAVSTKPSLVIESLDIIPPLFSASAVLAQDYETGQILYQKNINGRLAPASTTKIITALVAVDYFDNNDVLTVTPGSMVGGSTMGLVLGETITFKNLLYGMLLNSGNDAAFTIAENYPGGMWAFVQKMNEKSKSLGLADTNFQNPAGFDHTSHYSSAADLVIISKLASSNPLLLKIFSTKELTVYSFDGSKMHRLQNLNKLLSDKSVLGIKTGFTQKAGENLVGLVDRGGHKVLTVVLGSANRFEETGLLMDWVYKNYYWRKNI